MCDGKNDVIILEDLNAEGFYMPDRKKLLSLESLTLLIETLGKFHALSFAMKHEEPQRFQELSNKVKETIWSEAHMSKSSGSLFTKYGQEVYSVLRGQVSHGSA